MFCGCAMEAFGLVGLVSVEVGGRKMEMGW